MFRWWARAAAEEKGDVPPQQRSAGAAGASTAVGRDTGVLVEAPVRAEDIVRTAFWIVLWRSPSEGDLRECVRAMDAKQTPDDLIRRLLASTEFRSLLTAVREGGDTGRTLRVVCVGARIDSATPRTSLTPRIAACSGGRWTTPGRRSMWASWRTGARARDCARIADAVGRVRGRYGDLSRPRRFIPRDVQLCELASIAAKWEQPELADPAEVVGSRPGRQALDAPQGDEFAPAPVRADTTRSVFARMYRAEQSGGPRAHPLLARQPRRAGSSPRTCTAASGRPRARSRRATTASSPIPPGLANFPYREDRLVSLKMDGRFLAFPDASFEVVYSLSSIEHFGGFDGASAAIADMARVLKPGGILALATEYCLCSASRGVPVRPGAGAPRRPFAGTGPADRSRGLERDLGLSTCASIPTDPAYGRDGSRVGVDFRHGIPPSSMRRARYGVNRRRGRQPAEAAGTEQAPLPGPAWPIWIFVFFIAPGPLTFDLFERGFDLRMAAWLAVVLIGTGIAGSRATPGREPKPYIIRFTEDRPNPLYRRV